MRFSVRSVKALRAASSGLAELGSVGVLTTGLLVISTNRTVVFRGG